MNDTEPTVIACGDTPGAEMAQSFAPLPAAQTKMTSGFSAINLCSSIASTSSCCVEPLEMFTILHPSSMARSIALRIYRVEVDPAGLNALMLTISTPGAIPVRSPYSVSAGAPPISDEMCDP